jgi:hypothetical protein
MRHFHYERSLHLSYNTVLPGQFSFAGERPAWSRLVSRRKETRTTNSIGVPASLKFPTVEVKN